MDIKKLIIQVSVSFTMITLYSGIIEMQSGIKSATYSILFFRLILCIIGFGSMVIFDVLEHKPLRFVQIIHYSVTMSLISMVIWIYSTIISLDQKFLINTLISSTVIYLIIAIFYEIKLRREIKKHNRLLELINK